MKPVMITAWMFAKLAKGPEGSGDLSTIWTRQKKDTSITWLSYMEPNTICQQHIASSWPAETGDRSYPDCCWQGGGSGWLGGPRWCRRSPCTPCCCGPRSEPGWWCWSRPTEPCTGWSPGWSCWFHSRPSSRSCLWKRQRTRGDLKGRSSFMKILSFSCWDEMRFKKSKERKSLLSIRCCFDNKLCTDCDINWLWECSFQLVCPHRYIWWICAGS